MKNSVRRFAVRHASVLAAVVLVMSIVTFVVYLLLDRSTEESESLREIDLLFAACQVLPYGLVGAVLVARRPDLPFGWLLSLGTLALAIELPLVVPAHHALETGGGGEIAVWAVSFGALGFLPTAIEGMINIRFPSGQPAGRLGRLVDRALVIGIGVALMGGVLGDNTIKAAEIPGVPGQIDRTIDGTPVTSVGNAMALATPLVILLGVLAGIGIIVRFFRSEGLERKQLQWRAVGVSGALVLFPFFVTGNVPIWVGSVAPLLFVITLVVPVLRYDLWAIDSLIRRSAAFTLSSASGTTAENLVRAVGEMLRLSHVSVLREDVVLATYGEVVSCSAEIWILEDDRGSVGTLRATARHGRTSLDDRDRQVLATVARLVTEAVRAEALNAELLQARNELVTAREEERRRLRRDLHDGLGPLLTGLGLNLDAARTSIGNDDDKTATYLGQAKEASAQVIQDLRQLVQDLRPPAIDEIGLAGAIQLHVTKVARDSGLSIELTAPSELQLPAAVEVATFRTVAEAINNTVRHSDARQVQITIDVDESRLTVVVSDDGTGAQPWRPGVGLSSMRERAEELGGTLEAGPTDAGGRIHANYPLRRMRT